jgi:hypothetical protein
MGNLSIPAFHISGKSKVKGEGLVHIISRMAAGITGTFSVSLSVSFDPGGADYPSGTLSIKCDLTDGSNGVFSATSIELINSYGEANPTVCLTGQCKVHVEPSAKGCRFWLLIANNKSSDLPGTPDVVAFAIHDRMGKRIAYGTGPVRTGDFTVSPS